MDDIDKKSALSDIMAAAHVLADIAWPHGNIPRKGTDALIDVQIAAAKALGLPDDLPLMSGDPQIDDPI